MPQTKHLPPGGCGVHFLPDMMYLLCVLIPPLAVFLTGRMGAFLVSLLLTFLGWLPGVIHAFFIVSDSKADQRAQDTIEAIRRERGR